MFEVNTLNTFLLFSSFFSLCKLVLEVQSETTPGKPRSDLHHHPRSLPSAGTSVLREARDQGVLSLSRCGLCLQGGAAAPGPWRPWGPCGSWGQTWPLSSGLRGGPPRPTVEQGAVLACTVFLEPRGEQRSLPEERNRTWERWERKALAQRRLLSRSENSSCSDSMFSFFT